MSEEIREEQVQEESVNVKELETEETAQEEPAGETVGEQEKQGESETSETKEIPGAKPSSDSVPLSKYMQEKKRRQELERVFAQQEEERNKYRIYQELVQRGYPDYEAQYLANERITQNQQIEELKSRQLDYEIKDLAKDPFFADAEIFKDEIKDKMKSLKVDAETAYMMLRGKVRAREYQLEQEQRNLAKRRQVESKKVVNAAPSAPKNPYPLDDFDKKALAELQKAQPDAGWTIEKYWKLMKT